MGGGVDAASEVADVVLLGDRVPQVGQQAGLGRAAGLAAAAGRCDPRPFRRAPPPALGSPCSCTGTPPPPAVPPLCLQVLDVLQLSRATLRKIKQNMWWAAGYNLIGIPLAAGAMLPITGLALTPSLSGACMACRAAGGGRAWAIPGDPAHAALPRRPVCSTRLPTHAPLSCRRHDGLQQPGRDGQLAAAAV